MTIESAQPTEDNVWPRWCGGESSHDPQYPGEHTVGLDGIWLGEVRRVQDCVTAPWRGSIDVSVRRDGATHVNTEHGVRIVPDEMVEVEHFSDDQRIRLLPGEARELAALPHVTGRRSLPGAAGALYRRPKFRSGRMDHVNRRWPRSCLSRRGPGCAMSRSSLEV